jgi:hypothetical protein
LVHAVGGMCSHRGYPAQAAVEGSHMLSEPRKPERLPQPP